ncbi:uncharacterized protein LOC108204449 isoform X2 [Daucus carota subsp. sativus]|uniref:uncharacterized protein LOC108204449 isoform X2 n=1 Tax=Daucus carota subsp. sativus TaxID=79200 RepID=UPI0007EF6582|nr:PREDICTED: serine/threonine-protein phosphatase 4 regulatory subunit 3 isoform X2 [Daucus carota subsp. sativus]
MVDHSPLQLVKVYHLNTDEKWDDQGTGHVTVDYLERSGELGLFLVDEEKNETLLLQRISSEDIYRKQGETIISWRSRERSSEIALSFQEKTGCSYIWDQICCAQRSLQFSTINNDAHHAMNNDLRELPPVELSTLALIHKTVVEGSITDQCRVTELIVHDQGFLRKLMDLFRVCEDLEDIDSLHMLYRIVKGIILFNSLQILERVLGDELIMDLTGCLEYDPEILHTHHRKFLRDHVVFKEAIPIKDPRVLSKIHQTYRIRYLKDVVLPRVLDDATIGSLNSMLHSNNAFIITMLKDDSTFIKELFARLNAPVNSAESKKNMVLFLHEFCCLIKSLQTVHQFRFLRDLINEGIIDVIAGILQSEDKRLRLTGADILILFLNQDPNLTICSLTRQKGVPLVGLLVKGMLTDFGDDMHNQFVEILRNLLDGSASGSQRDTIIDIFYEKHLNQLIDVITSSIPSNGARKVASSQCMPRESRVKPEILLIICDLLCFCVSHHFNRIKCNFLTNNIIDKVLILTRRREKYLVVAAVRFFRILVSWNDDRVMNHIVRNNLLKPIIDAFVQNGRRYNLLHSAVLELFEHIRKNDSKVLLKYLVESFWFQLVVFNLPSIHSLKVRYEQSLEIREEHGPTNVLYSRRRTDEIALDKEEEDYFNGDSDEEDSASGSLSRGERSIFVSNGSALSQPSVSSRSCRPVNHADNGDVEKYKPPPRKRSEESEENAAEPVRLKRKFSSMEEPRHFKRQRLCINPKSKDSVFAALCSTLSQVVLPSKKIASSVHTVPRSASIKIFSELNNEEGSICCSPKSSDVENHADKEPLPSPKSCPDSLLCLPAKKESSEDDFPLGGCATNARFCSIKGDENV